MRRGEMLPLRFGDTDCTRRMITLRGAATKSRRTRLVSVGTARLLGVIEWLRLDSVGERKADEVAVFSNEAGGQLSAGSGQGDRTISSPPRTKIYVPPNTSPILLLAPKHRRN